MVETQENYEILEKVKAKCENCRKCSLGSKTVRAGTACGYCCGTPKDGTGTHNAKSRAQQHEAADL